MFKQLKTNGGLASTCIESTCYLEYPCKVLACSFIQTISVSSRERVIMFGHGSELLHLVARFNSYVKSKPYGSSFLVVRCILG
jgi:hypothetical protein